MIRSTDNDDSVFTIRHMSINHVEVADIRLMEIILQVEKHKIIVNIVIFLK